MKFPKRFPNKAKRTLYGQMARAFSRVAVRRRREGPRRPSWSFRYEALIELLRIQFGHEGDDTSPETLRRVRRAFDKIGDQEEKRNRSQTEWTELERPSGSVTTPMKAAWVTPKHFAPSEGVVLYLHGGGYNVGSPRSHRGMMGSIATHGAVKVLGIDYRLAPEHACPAAIDDALTAYRWMLERFAPEHVIIAGDSAGGGLTASTLVAARDAGLPMPAGGVLLSPWLDLEGNDEPDQGFDYIFPGEDNAFARAYAGERPFTDPQVSPVHANLEGLPPLLVLAGEVETIAYQSIRFAEVAKEAGVEVHLHVEPDEIHVYPAFFELSPRGQAGLGRIGHFIRQRI